MLPLVASMTVWPGFSAPLRSASSMTARAMRSLTEPIGLKDSTLTYTLTPGGRELVELHQRRIADRFENVLVAGHVFLLARILRAAPWG